MDKVGLHLVPGTGLLRSSGRCLVDHRPGGTVEFGGHEHRHCIYRTMDFSSLHAAACIAVVAGQGPIAIVPSEGPCACKADLPWAVARIPPPRGRGRRRVARRPQDRASDLQPAVPCRPVGGSHGAPCAGPGDPCLGSDPIARAFFSGRVRGRAEARGDYRGEGDTCLADHGCCARNAAGRGAGCLPPCDWFRARHAGAFDPSQRRLEPPVRPHHLAPDSASRRSATIPSARLR